jgi:hypothetical protein
MASRRLAPWTPALQLHAAACSTDSLQVTTITRRRRRRSRTEEAHDGSQGQRARHPAGISHLTTAGQSVYAPVRSMRELHASERNSGSAKGLHGQHWRTTSLDRAMILALLIGTSHKNRNSMVYPEPLNAPEPSHAPSKQWRSPDNTGIQKAIINVAPKNCEVPIVPG